MAVALRALAPFGLRVGAASPSPEPRRGSAPRPCCCRPVASPRGGTTQVSRASVAEASGFSTHGGGRVEHRRAIFAMPCLPIRQAGGGGALAAIVALLGCGSEQPQTAGAQATHAPPSPTAISSARIFGPGVAAWQLEAHAVIRHNFTLAGHRIARLVIVDACKHGHLSTIVRATVLTHLGLSLTHGLRERSDRCSRRSYWTRSRSAGPSKRTTASSTSSSHPGPTAAPRA